MFAISRLDHVVLRARDAQGMVRFYCDVLGCTVERTLDIGLVQLRAGESIIDIVSADGELGRRGGPPPGEGRNLDHFCLRVNPFDEADIRAQLDRHDVTGTDVTEVYGAEGFGPSIYVQDPEGNTVELKGPATRGL